MACSPSDSGWVWPVGGTSRRLGGRKESEVGVSILPFHPHWATGDSGPGGIPLAKVPGPWHLLPAALCLEPASAPSHAEGQRAGDSSPLLLGSLLGASSALTEVPPPARTLEVVLCKAALRYSVSGIICFLLGP